MEVSSSAIMLDSIRLAKLEIVELRLQLYGLLSV